MSYLISHSPPRLLRDIICTERRELNTELFAGLINELNVNSTRQNNTRSYYDDTALI